MSTSAGMRFRAWYVLCEGGGRRACREDERCACVYVSELAPPQRRGLWSSSVFVRISLGMILARLLGVL